MGRKENFRQARQSSRRKKLSRGEYKRRVFARQQEDAKSKNIDPRELFEHDWGYIEGALVVSTAYTYRELLDMPVSIILEHFEYVEYFRNIDAIMQLSKLG
jgi:hypothetical protein